MRIRINHSAHNISAVINEYFKTVSVQDDPHGQVSVPAFGYRTSLLMFECPPGSRIFTVNQKQSRIGAVGHFRILVPVCGKANDKIPVEGLCGKKQNCCNSLTIPALAADTAGRHEMTALSAGSSGPPMAHLHRA